MSYKLITFDFTGTLMRFRLPPPVQYEKVASLYGIEIKNKEVFKNKFRTAFQNVNKTHPNFGASTQLHWTKWWLRVIKDTFINAGEKDDPKLDAISWHLIKVFSTTQGWEVIPGVEKLLFSLRQQGTQMGVISNMDPRIENILVEAGIRHYFKFVVASYEVQCFKPYPEIFKIALEKHGKEEIVNPSDCCHIGDSYHEDYLGALQSGWNAILVNELPSPNKVDPPAKDWCRNFQELDELLQQKQKLPKNS